MSRLRVPAVAPEPELVPDLASPITSSLATFRQRAAFDDPRNGLVRDFVRIVAEIEPRTFVFENVKGLTVGRHREFLFELVEEFSRTGYVVRVPWRVLNAGHFGTPQNRKRLILLGARRGDPLPDYPGPVTEIANPHQRIADSEDLFAAPRGPTCSDALRDLPDAEGFEELIVSDSTETANFGEPSEYAAQLRCLTSDAWHYGYMREWNPAVLTSSARTEYTAISRQRFRATEPGTVEPISRFFKLSEFGVSNTLRAGTDGARGGHSLAHAPSTTSMIAASPCERWPVYTGSRTGSASM